MPDKSKFEQEIDEILEKSEDNAKRPSRGQRSAGPHRSFEPFTPSVPKTKARKRSSSIKFNPGNLIIGGFIFIAIGAFLSVATLPLAIVGVALIGVGYLLWFRRGNRGFVNSGSNGGSGLFGRGRSTTQSQSGEPEVKYWRGRRIEEKPAPGDRGKIIEFGSPDDDKS